MQYVHFKMETWQLVLELAKPHCFTTSPDLKDVYYSVSINPDHTKYLKPYWKGQLYKFLVLPQVSCSRPRKFTKLLQPLIANLRINDYMVAISIDELVNVGLTFRDCVDNIMASIYSLGFINHLDKSSFMPKQNITFLGLTFKRYRTITN